jgi:hypothetical protein
MRGSFRRVRWLAVVSAGAVALFTGAVAREAVAGEIGVASSAQLVAAIGAAAPGDTIVLADGTYALGDVSCDASGTEASPIVVRSANPLGAVLELSGIEGFRVRGSHWHFEDLDVRGVCPVDDACEHAFHVVGGDAKGFALRKSRIRDFNAQLKVNAAPDASGVWRMADAGLVEYSELADTRPRLTANPVTKLNIDGGVGWVVRGNYVHDFHKDGGNGVSYGAFMKSGGSGGLFERNLVACTRDVDTGGVRIGLSFGGGGTGPQYCAPAFDPAVPCDVEHTDGVMRNNVLLACSDVGIYVNRGANTKLLHNTLVATAGIDFRFPTTTGEAHGNLLMGKIRARDGGTFADTSNVAEQPLELFTALYADPLALDFHVVGDPSALAIGPTRTDLLDDYCARDRPATSLALGALEHSAGDCEVLPPPEPQGEGGGAGAGGNGPTTGATGATTGAASGGTGGAGAGTGAGGDDAADEASDGSGCSCAIRGSHRGRFASSAALALGVLAFVGLRARIRPRARRGPHRIAR